MKKEDLNKLLPYFKMYSESDYYQYSVDPIKAKWYFHKGEEFHMVVFEDGEVYQGGTEANIVGVELKNFEDFRTRFISFTGEDIDCIDPRWDIMGEPDEQGEPDDLYSDLYSDWEEGDISDPDDRLK